MADETELGTLDNPIIVKSAGDEQYAGCTGYPADSHNTIWLTVCLQCQLGTEGLETDIRIDVTRSSYRKMPRMW
jgi:hypothetical protein